MKEETIDKICHSLDAAYHYAQVIFSVLVIIFGVGYALMNIVRGSSAFITLCFGAIAYVGYKLMLHTSLVELRAFKNQK